jgi:hypothetical protein
MAYPRGYAMNNIDGGLNLILNNKNGTWGWEVRWRGVGVLARYSNNQEASGEAETVCDAAIEAHKAAERITSEINEAEAEAEAE